MFILLISLISIHANAILDSLVQTSKDSYKAAIIADAAADLYDEVDPGSENIEAIRKFRDRQYQLYNTAQDLYFIGEDVKDFLKGPDLTAKGIEKTMRATTSFIRKGKRLVANLVALGPDGAGALATIQSSATLNEILTNQSLQMADDRNQKLLTAKKEVQKEKDWQDLILREKTVRHKGVHN